ncbi:hypothetical protein MNBD_GAMMA18-516 [hydrothermal vent metagenome]|uniref:Uncharacterized protein n=1 Tax=hydrothermal vent metagenome TaxID=652676 RepID=A0A3B0Z9Q9_9ZZZZ
MSENYTLNPGITLPIGIKVKVKKIADEYYSLTNNKVVVTSGVRTAKSQAVAMYGKLSGGDSLIIYKNQIAAKEIKKAYDDGSAAKKPKNEIISDIEKRIGSQVKKGIYISKHLKEGAVDIRSRDMSSDEKTKFKRVAKGFAVVVILETTPPHFHLQF